MSKEETMYLKNDKGQVIYIQGKLPNGDYGISADSERPFTDEELRDPKLFEEHQKDLAKRSIT